MNFFDLFKNFFYPKSSFSTISIASVVGILLWISLRLWWTFFPVIFIPLIVGLLLSTLLKKADILLTTLIIELISIIFFPIPNFTRLFFFGVSETILMSTLLLVKLFLHKYTKRLPYFALAIILVGFLVQGAYYQAVVRPVNSSPVADLLNYEPKIGAYDFDGDIYLKTFYLHKHGENYYHAIGEAILGDTRYEGFPSSIIGWRLPTVFYFWNLFSNGQDIAPGFLVFGVLVSLFSFLIARELSNDCYAVVPAALICGYLMYGALTMWITFVEYWGLLPAFISAYFFVRDRTSFSVIFAVIASLFRELYIFTFAAGFLSALAHKQHKKYSMWIVGGLLF